MLKNYALEFHSISPIVSFKCQIMPKQKIYKQKFRAEWMKKPEFKGWLLKVDDGAYCQLCKCKLAIKYSDLVAHKTTRKHTTASENRPVSITNFFTPKDLGTSRLKMPHSPDTNSVMVDNTTLKPPVELPLDPATLSDLVEKAKDYALLHGIGMKQKSNYDRDGIHFAPFVLFPTPFPREEFSKAVNLQTVLNELMHKVAHDDTFLREALKNTIKVDDFTGKLFDVYEKVREAGGSPQATSLGMLRSDLMLDKHCCITREKCCKAGEVFCCWKQVELNTIASGFGWLGPASGLLHRYVVQEAGRPELLENIPENRALEGLAGALVEAWRIYNKKESVILFLVEDVTYNIADQKFHEFEIRKQCPEAYVIRKTLTDMGQRGSLTEDKRLMIDGKEVAVIYMRCGYHPDQYPTSLEWDARLMMELSLAIKSPSIHYHLAGTKKVQQELAKPGTLERFLGDRAKIDSVRDIFTGLYSLDNDEAGNVSYQKAMEEPEKYVLKPQREGGGNNVYGKDIKPFLENMQDGEERNAYIMMDMIEPPITLNYMVRPGQAASLVNCVSELGIFGYVIGDKDEIRQNKQVGHMLRTKLSHVNEGGVAAGLGALDSVYLVDAMRCCPGPVASS